MANERDIDAVVRPAAAELPGLATKGEVETWWKKYYLIVGHRRLGQLMIGRTVGDILRTRTRAED